VQRLHQQLRVEGVVVGENTNDGITAVHDEYPGSTISFCSPLLVFLLTSVPWLHQQPLAGVRSLVKTPTTAWNDEFLFLLSFLDGQVFSSTN
jgi:hypothetical protein